LETITDADQIIVLDRGEIVECGTHDDLLVQGGLYAELVRLHRTLISQDERPSPEVKA
jgi:ATP-binding cassette subfamily B protein